METEVSYLLHEVLEPRDIKTVLALKEFRPGLDLLGQPRRAPVVRRHEGIGSSPEEQPGRLGQLSTAQEHAFIAHDADGAQQLDGVKIENPLRLRVIADADIITGQAQHVAYPHGRASQYVS